MTINQLLDLAYTSLQHEGSPPYIKARIIPHIPLGRYLIVCNATPTDPALDWTKKKKKKKRPTAAGWTNSVWKYYLLRYEANYCWISVDVVLD